MPEQIRFDGRVAIVTGAGAGLGRSYALLLAERGASVIVNDLGGGRDGDGKSSKAADTVVNEIRNKGGKAAADYNSVVDGEKIVQTALENFGRVDIVINNAGILRDRSFARISDTDWNLVHDVHLKGAFKVSQAAWPHMKKQNYGRIVMTSSNSGLLGNFGQANYSAAKMGLVGLSNTLALEGEKNNIHCNVIVPTAASRLTQDILPPDFFEELRPDLIAPVVAWLCHEDCEDSGSIIDSAVGWAAKCDLVRGEGTLLRQSITHPVMLENVRRLWTNVTDMTRAAKVDRMEGTVGNLMNKLNELKNGASHSASDRQVLDFIEGHFSYTSRDAILYALGIGATTREASDLKYLYEGHEDFAVLPSFGVIPGLLAVMSSDLTLSAIPGKEFDLSQVLHGEQYLTLHQPLPTQGDMVSRARVVDVMDKGKNAVIVVQTESYVGNEHISTGQSCVFIVGGGGFGGQRESSKAVPCQEPPRRAPDSSLSEATSVDQAALYRLSGDINPLHIDPDFARISGYKTPILHGLCSLGFAIRAVLKQYAGNDPALFLSLKVRFSKPVLPGQTLRTDMWKERQRVHFQTSVAETDQVVISGAYVDLKPSVRPSATKGPSVGLRPVNAAEELISEAVYDGMKERVQGNPDLVKKVNGVFVYVILKNGKKADTWTADLKKGKVYKGEPEAGTKADTTITVDDADLVDIALGKLNPQAAFMKGKLKIKGNIMLTQKLKLLMPQDSKL